MCGAQNNKLITKMDFFLFNIVKKQLVVYLFHIKLYDYLSKQLLIIDFFEPIS